jgi:hypothetical protein
VKPSEFLDLSIEEFTFNLLVAQKGVEQENKNLEKQKRALSQGKRR